ncbi:hypothetical protein DFQ14_101542 [Halopolyspora algeriensis]|uniref:Uncharacterized protein n=1 Tax=Halopolyspora algeriensis TaxID=1500506 RepID=A0A368VYB6_9ACTN|nr:hypothetical protein [Halopolyspora algeriensis]RCW47196.1 hypothetical protein DFQ14_101542 [Halopolyspora algeriensis]TQM48282.1 hypothetical protein FHU43_3248 [Halopolyspora algeriensis]
MSGADQCSEGTRVRRVLNRALVFTGTTVAGTSIAWLLCTGVAAAADSDPSDAPDCASPVSSEEKRAAPESDPPVGEGLGKAVTLVSSGLGSAAPDTDRSVSDDSTRSIPDGPTSDEPAAQGRGESCGVLAPVAGAVRDTVHSADRVLTPVRRAADEVLAGEGGHESLPGAIDRSLDALERPLRSLLPGTSAPPPEDRNTPDSSHGGDDDDAGAEDEVSAPPRDFAVTSPTGPVSSTPKIEEHSASAEAGAAFHADSAWSAPGSRGAPDVPPGPGPVPMQPMAAVVPAVGNSGGTTDGHAHIGLLPGRSDGSSLSTPLSSSALARSALALERGTRPQPGITPD